TTKGTEPRRLRQSRKPNSRNSKTNGVTTSDNQEPQRPEESRTTRTARAERHHGIQDVLRRRGKPMATTLPIAQAQSHAAVESHRRERPGLHRPPKLSSRRG